MKTKRICPQEHVYYKSSTCTTCPTCEELNKPSLGFLTYLSAPARRALTSSGIDSLEKLAHYSEKEILKLHGIGKTSIPILQNLLHKEGLTFIE